MLAADFGFNDELLAQIAGFLNTSSDGLRTQPINGVGAQVFGVSPASVQCASDAGKAQQHVKQALLDMEAGLQRYVDALKSLQTTATTVDTTTADDLTKKIAAAESCQTPDFTNVGVCS